MRGESSFPNLATCGRYTHPEGAFNLTRELYCEISDFLANVHFGLFQQYQSDFPLS